MAALTEFELIDRFFRRPESSTGNARGIVLGIGDDAALLAPTPGNQLAASVDMLVSGHHFFANVEPEALGHKALAVNLSDMAAMGATPRWALLAGALPDADAQWLKGFARGFFALAAAHGVDLVGGDTTRGPLNLCVTLLGEVPAGKALLRGGALAGDSIWVSGALGDASLALAHHAGRIVLTADEAAACWNALLRPAPAGRSRHTVARPCIGRDRRLRWSGRRPRACPRSVESGRGARAGGDSAFEGARPATRELGA